MSNGREKILAAARSAQIVDPVDPEVKRVADEKIAAAIKTTIPVSDEGLVKQFGFELENVSAEFHLISDQKEMAEKVVAVLRECDQSSLAITAEDETVELAGRISRLDNSITICQALDYTGEERKKKLAAIPIALTKAAFGIADMGSLVFLYDQSLTSWPYFLSDTVFALVSKSNLVSNHFELLEKLNPKKARNMVFVTGPSRTADIEKILILGAHGPRRLVVLLY